MRIPAISKNVKFAISIVTVAILAFSIGNIELAKDVNSASQPSTAQSAPANPNGLAKPSQKASATPSQKASATPSQSPTKKPSTTKEIPSVVVDGSGAGSAEKIGIKTSDVENLEGIVTDIDSYIAAIKGGNTTLATQLCTSLNGDYNKALKLIQTTSSVVKIEQLLSNSKEAMFAAVSDCATGLSRSNDALVNQSVTEFASASKFLKALVKLQG
jgi:hypothetical protein